MGITAAICATGGRGQDVAPALTATITRPIHPVLIRNEHGPLLRVIIEVPDKQAVTGRSLSVSLAGTNDLDALASLTLFFTADKTAFSPAVQFAERQKPAETITFRGEQSLQPGRNVFWLSCRLKDTADQLHRVAASCPAIETTAGKLRPRDESPAVQHRIGIALRRHNDDGVHTYRIPALTTTAGGTLLCAYDMRRRTGRDLQGDIDIGLSRSADRGRTWSKPENLTRKLKNEAWWLFAPSPQQGIQLADGTLVMPSGGRHEKGVKFSTIMTSRDHGASWTVATPAYSGGSECQAVQLGDGSLMLNMRNEHEHVTLRTMRYLIHLLDRHGATDRELRILRERLR